MTLNGVVMETLRHGYQPGSQDTIDVPLNMNVDMCRLLVIIRAENSAGMSSPTEIEVGRSHYPLNRGQKN